MTQHEMSEEWAEEWQSVLTTEPVPDFSGPCIEEIFDENPCLLEIGPLSLHELIYGDMKLVSDVNELPQEERAEYAAIVLARIDVATNFMKFFNIKTTK